MGADKNSSRMRWKLQQDELGQIPKITRSACNLLFAKTHSHWSTTGPRNKHYLQPLLLHTHDSENDSEATCLEGAVRPGMGEVRRPPSGNQEILRNTSTELQNSPRFHQQKFLVKAKLATRRSWKKPNSTQGPRGG
jgi:hypothetical protein